MQTKITVSHLYTDVAMKKWLILWQIQLIEPIINIDMHFAAAVALKESVPERPAHDQDVSQTEKCLKGIKNKKLYSKRLYLSGLTVYAFYLIILSGQSSGETDREKIKTKVCANISCYSNNNFPLLITQKIICSRFCKCACIILTLKIFKMYKFYEFKKVHN